MAATYQKKMNVVVAMIDNSSGASDNDDYSGENWL
jgi:hypothetical protein